jgi:hypothetical protein
LLGCGCGGGGADATTDAGTAGTTGETADDGATMSGSASASGSASGSATMSGSATQSSSDATADSGSDGDDDTGPAPGTALLDRLAVVDVAVPEGVRAGASSWRIWGTGPLNVAPVFTVPLTGPDGCETLVGYTSDTGGAITARVVRLDGDGALVTALEVGADRELRGLAAEPDGHFGALVWDPVGQRIWIDRFAPDGTSMSSTELTNPDNSPTDFGIGDSRLEYGDGTYGAYYHVHSDSGHEGDTLKWVAAASGVESTQWGWGCSHSMSDVLRWNTSVGQFLSACVTDCYPGTDGDFATQSIGGVYLEAGLAKIIDVDAGCNGSVAGELGGAAPYPGGWGVVFNGHRAPASLGQSSYDPGSMDQDIGFSAVTGDRTPGPVVWLTGTPGLNEDDSSIAYWQPEGEDVEQFVVGWHEPPATYRLARIDASGTVLEGPVDASAVAAWGRRDDPFREHGDADVVWSWFDTPGSTTLHMARIDAGIPSDCN